MIVKKDLEEFKENLLVQKNELANQKTEALTIRQEKISTFRKQLGDEDEIKFSVKENELQGEENAIDKLIAKFDVEVGGLE